MDHTYEEIRDVSLDILAGRERASHEPTQYQSLLLGVLQVLDKRSCTQEPHSLPWGGQTNRSTLDTEIFLEVFWDLFRQGIITLGVNDSNREFPWFRVSSFGKRILDSHDIYFFHDVSTYEKVILQNVPSMNPVTLLYLKESMQAFHAGCILSCSVMLGVAAEHTFLQLMETVNTNPEKALLFKEIEKERTILRKTTKFRNIILQHIKDLPPVVAEDLDLNVSGIQSIIRNYRNEAGHPTGKIIEREQAYVLLNLFIPYCKKMYQLKEFYASTVCGSTPAA